MEEDIEDLKKYISFANKSGNFSHDTDWKWHKELADKIENLLTRYKQLEEENKEIKKEFAINTEIHKRDEIIKDLKETINCLHETDKENYIPKSKVKEKIEELKKDVINLDTYPNFSEQEVHREIVEVLQELLREE